jgi:predicted kinase
LSIQPTIGVGKSTLSRAVAATLKWPLISKDDIRDHTCSWDAFCNQHLAATATAASSPASSSSSPLTASPSSSSTTTRTVQLDSNRLCYEIMWTLARTQLKCGHTGVIIECPLARESLYHRGCELARELNAIAIVIDCWLDGQTWSSRINQRTYDRHAARTELVTSVVYGINTDEPGASGIIIDDANEVLPEPASPFVGTSFRNVPSTTSIGGSFDRPSPLASSAITPPVHQITLDEAVARNTFHKPQTWTALRQLLAHYNGCYRYSLNDTPNLSLNMAVPIDQLRDRVIAFVMTLINTNPLLLSPSTTNHNNDPKSLTRSPSSSSIHQTWLVRMWRFVKYRRSWFLLGLFLLFALSRRSNIRPLIGISSVAMTRQ